MDRRLVLCGQSERSCFIVQNKSTLIHIGKELKGALKKARVFPKRGLVSFTLGREGRHDNQLAKIIKWKER